MNLHRKMTVGSLAFCGGLLLLLSSCTSSEPVRIGFIGGLSGRVADLGIAGRDGVIFAVERWNSQGGVRGRTIELLIEDDAQDPATAKAAMARLLDGGVEAVIGPMTSAMAGAVVDLANSRQTPLVSPTATTKTLSGIDDYFFRVMSSTSAYASRHARFHLDVLGLRRLAVVMDDRNQAYVDSWLADFREPYVRGGGELVAQLRFRSSAEADFASLARQLTATSAQGILILANSLDAALIAQHIRNHDPDIHLAASEWAGTERLIGLGGKAVENMSIAQFFDRQLATPAYLRFHADFLARFGHEPGFGGIAGYDAGTLVLHALASRGDDQTVKQALLSLGEVEGAQMAISLDEFGDSRRPTFLTTIRDGRFVPLEQ